MATQQIKVLGIHVSGAHNKHSAVIRGSFYLDTACSGLPLSEEHFIWQKHFSKIFPNLAYESSENFNPNSTSPFFWEAISAEIGPSKSCDSDVRLIEIIKDMGTVDIICIDAPISLPPCLECKCKCESITTCIAKSVGFMLAKWQEGQQIKPKKNKAIHYPQPYLDRYFEYLIRSSLKHPAIDFSAEFSPVMGSNKAPLLARASTLAAKLQTIYPEALLLECNYLVNTVGFSMRTGLHLKTLAKIKQIIDGQATRASILKRMEIDKLACRSATMHLSVFEDLFGKPGIFAAAMTALTARALLCGEISIKPELFTLNPQNPWRDWVCLPKEIVEYARDI